MTDNLVPSYTAPALLSLPAQGSGPGVLVLHPWWGLNVFFKGFCERLAAEGFVAGAPDLYNGVVAETIQDAQTLADAMDGKAALMRIVGTAEYLKQHEAVRGRGLGVIGFSMGAYWATRLAALYPQELSAIVLYYGAGWGEFSASRAAFQGHFAPGDPWQPDDEVDALEKTLREAGREVSFYRYEGAGHWFMEDNRSDDYHPTAAAQAWQRTAAFLHDRLD